MWGAGRRTLVPETRQALLAGVALLSLSLAPAAHAKEFPSKISLSSLNGANGFRLNGGAPYDLSGWSVSSAGDVNGDGFGDLIVGAHDADPNGLSSGSSYVVFGRKTGFAASLDLSTLNGTNGFRLDGAAAYDFSGWSVSGAGDVNGDGFADLIIGARGADPNGSCFRLKLCGVRPEVGLCRIRSIFPRSMARTASASMVWRSVTLVAGPFQGQAMSMAMALPI